MSSSKPRVQCASCQEPLSSKALKVADLYYHLTCLVCSDCGSSIPSGKFFTKEGKPTCVNCGSRVCAGCKQLILTGGLNAGDLGYWHASCLQCAVCGLEITHRFKSIVDGRPVCHKCDGASTTSSTPASTLRGIPAVQTSATSPSPYATIPHPVSSTYANIPAPLASNDLPATHVSKPLPTPGKKSSTSRLATNGTSIPQLMPKPAPPPPSIDPPSMNANETSSDPTGDNHTEPTKSTGLQLPTGGLKKGGSAINGHHENNFGRGHRKSHSLTIAPTDIPQDIPEPAISARGSRHLSSSNFTTANPPSIEPLPPPETITPSSSSPSTPSSSPLSRTNSDSNPNPSTPNPNPPTPISASTTRRSTSDDDEEANGNFEQPSAAARQQEEKTESEASANAIRASIAAANVPKMLDVYKRMSVARPMSKDATGQVTDAVTFRMLPGEDTLIRIEGIAWTISAVRTLIGWLQVTNGCISFMPAAFGNPKLFDAEKKGWRIYLGSILRIIRFGNISGKFYAFEIQCKDFKTYRLSTNSADDENKLYLILQAQTFRADFCVSHARGCLAIKPSMLYGWTLYDALEDYRRMSLGGASTAAGPSKFRVTHLNKDYQLCATYPRLLVVPSSITDEDLKKVAVFRSKGRLPAVIYRHPNDAVLVRCAQPRTGLKGTRCDEDEKLFNYLCRLSNNPKKPLLILDARPQLNAVANTFMGAGSEKASLYENARRKFLGIENIHVMRESLQKLRRICSNEEPRALGAAPESKVKDTGWLEHLATILQGAWRIVEAIGKDGQSVVVHCSDGWDRTPQLTSLTELLLDPYYRTMKGLACLIEKEWLSFGHMFATRCGHFDAAYDDKERSPIFTQFLDTVFQLLSQFPKAFEFNEFYLLWIAKHLYSCRYGTFLTDSDQARQQYMKNTLSLWHMLSMPAKVKKWQNPSYHKVDGPLGPLKTAKTDMKLWRAYYLGYKR